MNLPEQHTRIVAADPIEVGDLRLLPSVLVNTRSQHFQGQPGGGRGMFHTVRMRPVSVVVETADGARWYEIPNTESDAISSMLAAAAGVAAIGTLIILLVRLIRRG